MVLLTLREGAGIMMKMKVIKLTYVIQKRQKSSKTSPPRDRRL